MQKLAAGKYNKSTCRLKKKHAAGGFFKGYVVCKNNETNEQEQV